MGGPLVGACGAVTHLVAMGFEAAEDSFQMLMIIFAALFTFFFGVLVGFFGFLIEWINVVIVSIIFAVFMVDVINFVQILDDIGCTALCVDHLPP